MAKRENLGDKNFEREWRDAFEDASEQPDSRVWSSIERELAYKQMAVLRRKARFSQWTAAAAIFIAAFLGINYLISDNNLKREALPITDSAINTESADRNGNDNNTGDQRTTFSESAYPTPNKKTITTNSLSNPGGFILLEEDELDDDQLLRRSSHTLIALKSKKPDQSKIDYTIESDTYRKMYNKPINGKFVRRNKKTNQKERFWAGVGVGSGSFDPNYQSGSTNLLASSLNLATAENYAAANTFRINNQSPAVREGMKSGMTIDMGVNIGVRISDHWLLESGVFYTQADAITQTNVVVESPNAVEPIAASSETRGVTQMSSLINEEKLIQYNYQDVNMDNQFQFASFPVKAGYILIDGKLNIVVNAGVATNLYLGNRLTDQNNEVASVSIGPGVSSPYREVSFAGLGGLQIGYAFFHQLELTIEPYMRQPITSLTKQSSSFNASPSSMGINTGIRYRFN